MFELPDLTYALLGVGALVAAALPRFLEGRPMSLPVVFLGAGLLIGLLPWQPFEPSIPANQPFVEHFTEAVVIIALMGAGLSIDRRVGRRRWRNTWRLLAIGMPLTIAGIAVLGVGMVGLAPAGALLLGACLAPTDPVLAGEVKVGEPAMKEEESDEDEVRFGLTSEAGLNDALAFPFVYAAVLLAQHGEAGAWLGRWALVDLLYRIAVGGAVGLFAGWALARLFFSARRQELRLAEHREGFVAIAATFLAYGAAELVEGYGFLAVFVTAVMIRSSERFHGYHTVLHSFVEQVERLLTVLVLLLVGVALADGVLRALTLEGVALVLLLIFVVRPLAGALSLVGGAGTRVERAAIAFFGVRGVGSIYYVAYGLGAATFADAEQVVGLIALSVAVSVVVHGITAGPMMSALDRRRGVIPPDTERTREGLPPRRTTSGESPPP